MSIDLTEAITEARYEIERDKRTPTWRFIGQDQHDTFLALELAEVAVEAAAPIIEAAVREQVAREIEAVDPVEWALAGQHAGSHAARIARNGATS